MVMCRDLDLAGLQLLYRMIPAVVPELQLEGLPAERDSGQLMPQANSKNRLPTEEPSDRIHRVGARFGIARPIRQKNPVGLKARTSSAGVCAGTTVTLQPSPRNLRRMFCLIPKS